jgi:Integrase core domain
MNAIMERWVGSVRREILDRSLIGNTAHLRKVLTEYEDHFNARRPHRVLNQASPLRPLPDPVDADVKVIRRDRLGGLIHPGRIVRQSEIVILSSSGQAGSLVEPAGASLMMSSP